MLDGFMKAYMHSRSFSGNVHQGGRSVAECGHVAREMGGVGGLSVYINHYEMKRIPYKRGVLRTSFPLWGVTVL
jgi:hypothetical protein